MSIEVLDQFRMVLLVVRVGPKSNSKQYHILSLDYFRQLSLHLFKESIVEELVSNPNCLAFVKGREKVVQARPLIKRRF